MAKRTAGGSRTTSQSRFSQVPSADIPRSVFDRSHGHKTTFDAGLLIPILVDEVLPADTFKMEANVFARLSTPIWPVMDNCWLDTQYFFVPYRLIWENWERFNGAQDDPADSVDFQIPQMTDTVVTGDLADYFGIPIGNSLTFSSLFHRAYNLIFKEWYRDENLQDSPVVDIDDGPDDPADYVVRRRGKRHDYFTSCLPFAQKGAAVELPLGSSAPISSTGDGIPKFTFGAVDDMRLQSTVGASPIINAEPGDPGDNPMEWDDPKLVADLSSATAATINQIREAFQIQRLLERDARGGTRYTELIRAHFGVTSPDARLQRPEYLGGSSARVVINPVAATFAPLIPTGDPKLQIGRLSGIGTVSDRAFWTKSFVEHGLIIGLASVRAELTYQQGIDRMFSRINRFDFYWPALAHLGEQEVLNKEIFADGSANDDLVFGYQERYAEYRYKHSRVSGIFRSDAAATLDAWHLALDFSSAPDLNAVFIEDNPPFARVVAAVTEPHFIFDSYFSYKCARPMPTYSVPGLIDHF